MDEQYILISIILMLISIIVSFYLGILLKAKIVKRKLNYSKDIITKAKEESKKIKEEFITKAQLEIDNLNHISKQENNKNKEEVRLLEKKIFEREEMIYRRIESLDKREDTLNNREVEIKEVKRSLDNKIEESNKVIELQQNELKRISGLDKKSAYNIIIKNVEKEMSNEISKFIQDKEEEAKFKSKKIAKQHLIAAMQKFSGSVTSERTVSVINIPSDDVKGRLIGREGRNIRAIEMLTGVDLIIDDTPDAVVVSSFDPIRREIAKITIEALIEDGRIHPGKIEEILNESKLSVEQVINEKGEEVVFETGIGKVPSEIKTLLGKLHYRTSYSQNVLKHSKEVAMISGKIAAELGENEILARRAGLLHDIGKAIDYTMEGSHVDIGMKIAKKYNEPEVVYNAIASHHGDYKSTSIISSIVGIADTLSAARPGARIESLHNYVERLHNLEDIAKKHNEVNQAFAISAGRELRVIVEPNKVDDNKVALIARKIRKEIEDSLTYPGTVKVTVIKEQRVIEIAK